MCDKLGTLSIVESGEKGSPVGMWIVVPPSKGAHGPCAGDRASAIMSSKTGSEESLNSDPRTCRTSGNICTNGWVVGPSNPIVQQTMSDRSPPPPALNL